VEAELEPLKQARALIVGAALSMTRLKPAMRRACILWYVDGLKPHQAASKVKRPRQFVHRAIATLRPRLDEVLKEVERHGAKV
jgi:DNA-directed RNA polymerase specialized sigma24 family protein